MLDALDVLGLGVVSVDDLIYVEQYPEPDAKMRVLDNCRQFGGLVGTALAAIAALGGKCGYAGELGSDELSLLTEQAMGRAGIRLERVIKKPGAGPVHSRIIIDQQHHTRNIFFDLSKMRGLEPVAIDEALIRRAKVLLIDQLGIEGKFKAVRIARTLGIPVVADFEWVESNDEQLSEFVDHLIVSADFAKNVTGQNDPKDIVFDLHANSHRMCTAVTYGSQGCYFCSQNSSSPVFLPALEVTSVDTNGCGDVFHGAYAFSIALGQGVPESLSFASAAAAVFASKPNGWKYLPTKPEVDSLLEQV